MIVGVRIEADDTSARNRPNGGQLGDPARGLPKKHAKDVGSFERPESAREEHWDNVLEVPVEVPARRMACSVSERRV